MRDGRPRLPFSFEAEGTDPESTHRLAFPSFVCEGAAQNRTLVGTWPVNGAKGDSGLSSGASRRLGGL